MLSVRGLSKAFGAKRVLDGVDLDLATGESLVVIGGSGTGKSVLLRTIVGLNRPAAATAAMEKCRFPSCDPRR